MEIQSMASYNRTNAVAYARKWALSRNQKYIEYENDCTNFVSQVMLAGGWTMVGDKSIGSRKSDSVWWYDKSAWYFKASYTWGGAQNFYNFLNKSKRGMLVGNSNKLQLGDLIQIKKTSGHIYHTMVVTGKDYQGDLLLSYHTSDHLDEPLSAVAKRAGGYANLVYWQIK